MSKDPVNPNKQRNYFYTPSHTPTASLPDFSSQTFTAFGTGHSAVFHTDSRAKKAVVVGASGGTKITTATALVAVLTELQGWQLEQSVDTPRLHQQLSPMEVRWCTELVTAD